VRGYNKWSHAVPISTVPAGRAPADEASQQCDALGIIDHLGQGVQPARLHQRRKKKTDIKHETAKQRISRHVPSSARSASQRKYSASSQARRTLPIRSARSSMGSLGFLSLIFSSYSKNYFACQVRLVDTKERLFLFSLNFDI
jgi:hypothetical protein